MEPTAVTIAGLLQLLGACFFFTPPEDQCSPAPTLGSWLFLLAILFFLWDIDIYPMRYMHMSSYWQLLIETVMAIFFAELGAVIVWCAVERAIYSISKELLNMVGINGCQPSRIQYCLLGLNTTAVSGALLWFMLEATDGMYYLERYTRQLRRNLRQGWRKMKCYLGFSKATRTSQLATRRRCARKDEDEFECCGENCMEED